MNDLSASPEALAARIAELLVANAALKEELAERRRAEMGSRASSGLFRAIIEGTTDTIFVKDLQGRYTLMNSAGARALRLPMGAILGSDDFALFQPDTARLLQSEDAAVIARREVATMETVGETAQGIRFENLVTKSPHYDDAGNVIGVIGIARNIGEMKSKERQLRTRALQGRVVADLGRRALAGLALEALFNEAVARVAETLEIEITLVLEHVPERGCFVRRAGVGCPAEIVGQDTPNDGPALSAGFTLAAGEPIIVPDLALETRFGVAPWMRDRGATSGMSVLISGESGAAPYGVLNAFSIQRREFSRDDLFFLQSIANVLAAATERRRTEEALGQARRDAEKADHAKSEFLSRMSHELRTPLNAILGFSQLLEMSALDARQREGTGHILKAGRHLLGLIDEVLDVARIESGRMDFDFASVETEVVLRDCMAMLQPMAATRSITLALEPATAEAGPTRVWADERRLRQVVLNLLSNAVKYSYPTGRVTLTSQPLPGNPARVRIGVRDTGPGISTADRARLFTPFERLGAQHTTTEGSGLGLALTKRLTEAMGGAIDVESTLGAGSFFWVEFDAPESRQDSSREGQASASGGAADSQAVTASSASEPTPVRLTVLHVEDNASNRRLLERVVLFCPGVRLISANDGRAGLALARAEFPDLIFLDLHLPGLEGDEVLRALKNDPRLAATPVVMVTADADSARAEALVAAGAASCLAKPLSVRDVLYVIEDQLLARGPIEGQI